MPRGSLDQDSSPVGERRCDLCRARLVEGPGLACGACCAALPEQPLAFSVAALAQTIADLELIERVGVLHPCGLQGRLEAAIRNARSAYTALDRSCSEAGDVS